MVETLTFLAYLFGNVHKHEARLEVASAALRNHQDIPTLYTCKGSNISLPLHWRHIPAGTQSLAFIMTDETALKGKRYLWAMYNIPVQQKQLKTNPSLLRNEKYAINSWGHLGYDGPCGKLIHHPYALKLYALDTRFYFNEAISAAVLKKAMRHHIIASAKIELKPSFQH
jgi:Raf kinase inhibitor-like YbhB/YbcL family protein